MSNELKGRRVAFLVASDGMEQVELTGHWEAVKAAGGTPTLVAPESGTVQGRHHLDVGDTFDVDATVDDASVDSFDALVLPGGIANPDDLRTQPAAVKLGTWLAVRSAAISPAGCCRSSTTAWSPRALTSRSN